MTLKFSITSDGDRLVISDRAGVQCYKCFKELHHNEDVYYCDIGKAVHCKNDRCRAKICPWTDISFTGEHTDFLCVLKIIDGGVSA